MSFPLPIGICLSMPTVQARIKSGQGKVIDVKQTPQGYYVVCEFDEEDVK